MTSDGPSTQATRARPLASVGIGSLLLAWVGNAASLAYNEFEYGFNDSVNHLGLLRDMVSLPLADVVGRFFAPDFFQSVNLFMLASTAAVLVAVAVPMGRAGRFVVLVVPLVIMGLVVVPVGLLAGVSSPSAGHDGEWLAEGWPIAEASALWSIFLIHRGRQLVVGNGTLLGALGQLVDRLHQWVDARLPVAGAS